MDQSIVDVLWVACANVSVGSATLPLPTQGVTVQVENLPTGTALCLAGVASSAGNAACTAIFNGQIPRYQDVLFPTNPITVVVFPAASTTMLIPFANVGPGYNTGIAVANTTSDPFGPANGGAAPQDGTVTFTMYKNDGTSKVYTTSSTSPGSGLSSGVVKSGSTYAVNLSELLNASSFGTTFTGYIFVQTNFTNGHGAATIYTSTGAAALSSPALVLGQISSAAPRPTPESLGQ